MSIKRTYAEDAKGWEGLLRALVANLVQLPQLEGASAKLEGLLVRFRDLGTQQAVHQATKQEMSRQLQAVVRDARKTATMIRAVLKEHYGIESEKLVEFGVQPFRARTRKVTVKPPAEEPAPGPADPQPAK